MEKVDQKNEILRVARLERENGILENENLDLIVEKKDADFEIAELQEKNRELEQEKEELEQEAEDSLPPEDQEDLEKYIKSMETFREWVEQNRPQDLEIQDRLQNLIDLEKQLDLRH